MHVGSMSGLSIDATNLDAVATLVVEEHRAAPACVVAAARWRDGRWRHGRGRAGVLSTLGPEAPPVDHAHLFDLASLTKPVVSLLLARLQRAGVLSRRERLGAVVPALAHTPSGPVPLDLFAAHRAGLEAHRERFVKASGAVPPAPASCGAKPKAGEGFVPLRVRA